MSVCGMVRVRRSGGGGGSRSTCFIKFCPERTPFMGYVHTLLMMVHSPLDTAHKQQQSWDSIDDNNFAVINIAYFRNLSE